MTQTDATTGEPVHDHLVVFYGDDGHLVDTVTEFFAPALSGAGAALIVATSDHRQRIRGGLEDAGVDVAAAILDGRLVVLDAAETLARFTPTGAPPDPERFRTVVGAQLDELSALGRPVLVYGEMVALLWGEGDVASAVALEAMWNDLGDHKEFRLLCGYPMGELSKAVGAEPFLDVCDLHSTVIPHEATSADTSWLEQLTHLLHEDGDADNRPEIDRLRSDFVASVVDDLRGRLLRKGEVLMAQARDTMAQIDRALPGD